MPNYYDIGDIVRVSSTFTDTGGTRADPSFVTFVFTRPTGVDVVVSGTSGGITHTTTGVYSYDITATASGPYHYRFSSTGVITSAAEWNFRVRRRYTTT